MAVMTPSGNGTGSRSRITQQHRVEAVTQTVTATMATAGNTDPKS